MIPIALERFRNWLAQTRRISAHLQVVILTSKLSGSLRSRSKSWKNSVICDSSVSMTSSKTVYKIKIPISRWAATAEVI